MKEEAREEMEIKRERGEKRKEYMEDLRRIGRGRERQVGSEI